MNKNTPKAAWIETPTACHLVGEVTDAGNAPRKFKVLWHKGDRLYQDIIVANDKAHAMRKVLNITQELGYKNVEIAKVI